MFLARSCLILPAIGCCALLLFSGFARAAAVPERPNFVIINCDDLGYGDVGVYGAKGYTTPNIDRLASQGIRFTRFYVAQAVCSASRTALLTGCYPNRVGIQGALGPKSKVGISDGEMTLGELVKQRNYAAGVFGKWHLGDAPRFLPTRHGFDEYLGLPYSNDMWPYHPEFAPNTAAQKRRQGFPDLPLIDGEKIVNAAVSADDQRKLTTWYTERAVRFIDAHHQQPFLLYLAHSMPHVPLFVSDKYQGKTSRGLFGDVIEEIDWSVGEVLAALHRHGLDERTLVIFTSDNGPWLSYGEHAGSAGPLREGKGTSWEGGIREPFIARLPGVIPAGAVCSEPAMTVDLLSTIAARIGAKPPEHTIDGLDIWPLLVGEAGAKTPHKHFWHYFADNQLQAVSSGPWKLILPHTYRTLGGKPGGTGGRPSQYEQRKITRPELYNVDVDLGETSDVAEQHPKIVKQLLAIAEEARAELGDSLTGRTGRGVREPGRLSN